MLACFVAKFMAEHAAVMVLVVVIQHLGDGVVDGEPNCKVGDRCGAKG
jgi:hypothetical protein